MNADRIAHHAKLIGRDYRASGYAFAEVFDPAIWNSLKTGDDSELGRLVRAKMRLIVSEHAEDNAMEEEYEEAHHEAA